MDDVEILKNTLTNTVQRIATLVQNYEVEIANLTTEIVRLQSEVVKLTLPSKKNATDNS